MLRAIRLELLFLLLFSVVAGSAQNVGQMREVSISPDGKFIALVYATNHTYFIYRIALDTGKATRLTDAKTGDESSPTFSTDGRQVAYCFRSGSGAHTRIVIGNVDGSGLKPWPASENDNFRPIFSIDN